MARPDEGVANTVPMGGRLLDCRPLHLAGTALGSRPDAVASPWLSGPGFRVGGELTLAVGLEREREEAWCFRQRRMPGCPAEACERVGSVGAAAGTHLVAVAVNVRPGEQVRVGVRSSHLAAHALLSVPDDLPLWPVPSEDVDADTLTGLALRGADIVSSLSRPSGKVRALLDRIERDDGGSEMQAVRRLLAENPAVSEHVARSARATRHLGAADLGRYVVGVVLRVAELERGRVRVSRAAMARAADRVEHYAAAERPPPLGVGPQRRLLPHDRDFVLRARALPRTRPELLDAVLADLFENPPATPWRVGPDDRAWVYLRAWITATALDDRPQPTLNLEDPT